MRSAISSPSKAAAVERGGGVALQLLALGDQLAEAELVGLGCRPPGVVAPGAARRRDDERGGGGHVELLGEVALLPLAGVAQQADLHSSCTWYAAFWRDCGRRGGGRRRGRLPHGGQDGRPHGMGRGGDGRGILQHLHRGHQVILDKELLTSKE